jgi:dTDP-4-amino-4,6-dideoxygalactose transaminase
VRDIPLASPSIDRGDISSVVKVLKSGNLAQGPEVTKFESNFSFYVEGRSCVAVNSGTSGLHLALLALNIGPGDEVLVPSFTFAATANSVALTGATPVFIDIDAKTFNLDPELIEKSITNRTKAIQVVHLYGLPANMERILEIANKYNLKVIEDAAQAHLASIDGKSVGTFGDAAVFSFYPTKNMTSGEGGMIVLKNPDVARVCKLLRNQGMEKRYENEIVGFNLRMSDLHAALGNSQLSKIESWTEKRIENAKFLSENIESRVTPKTPLGYRHVFHQYTLRINRNRDNFLAALHSNGIGAAVYYPTPVHKLPAYQLNLNLPNTEIVTSQVISIPVHPKLKKKQLKKIANVINNLLRNETYN